MQLRFPVLLGGALLAAGLAAPPAAAQTVKLGTLAPDGSGWHVLLKDMARKWGEASGGKVSLKIYPGGVAGNEGDMIRKLRVGQMHAAALSMVGLRDIDPALSAVGTPGLATTDEEFAYIYEKIQPVYEKRLEDLGFIVLNWGDTGWVRIYSNREGKTPAALKGLKIFAWSGDPGSGEAWRLIGMQPVVVSATDMLPSLTTGMIEGFANTPIMAMTARWYEHAKYVPDANWGRLGAATVMTKQAWERIPAEMRPKLMEIARAGGREVNIEVGRMSRDATEAMKKNGLKVLALNDAERAEWQKAAEKIWPTLRGSSFPAEIFDQLVRLRDEYRKSKGAR